MARLRGQAVALTLAVLVVGMWSSTARGADDDDDPKEKCGDDVFSKLEECIKYSRGQEDSPSDKCCRSVSEIRKSDPVCLCYIIQQTYRQSSQATSFGLRIDRLTALPTSCKIAGANVSDCAKLLKLPAGSPDNAIFNGSVKSNSNSSTDGSSGFRTGSNYPAASVAAATVSAIFWSIFC